MRSSALVTIRVMKQLLRKPFLLTLILSLPLWILLNNYIVAICVALLFAFLLSMIDSIIAIQRQRRLEQHSPAHRPDSNEHPSNTDSEPRS